MACGNVYRRRKRCRDCDCKHNPLSPYCGLAVITRRVRIKVQPNGETVTEGVIQAILMGLALYGIAGTVFALPFTLWGARAMDHGTHDTGFGFRLIILPGVIMLWPYLLARWIFGAKFRG